MPTFDYKCQNPSCFKAEEVVEKMVQKYDNVVSCVACEQPMQKLISVPNLGGMDKQGSSKSGDGNIARLLE